MAVCNYRPPAPDPAGGPRAARRPTRRRPLHCTATRGRARAQRSTCQRPRTHGGFNLLTTVTCTGQLTELQVRVPSGPSARLILVFHGVRNPPESVFGLDRIGRSASPGTRVRDAPDPAPRGSRTRRDALGLRALAEMPRRGGDMPAVCNCRLAARPWNGPVPGSHLARPESVITDSYSLQIVNQGKAVPRIARLVRGRPPRPQSVDRDSPRWQSVITDRLPRTRQADRGLPGGRLRG